MTPLRKIRLKALMDIASDNVVIGHEDGYKFVMLENNPFAPAVTIKGPVSCEVLYNTLLKYKIRKYKAVKILRRFGIPIIVV